MTGIPLAPDTTLGAEHVRGSRRLTGGWLTRTKIRCSTALHHWITFLPVSWPTWR